MNQSVETGKWTGVGLFCFLALIFFWPAREAGFVTDWLGGQLNYENGSIGDALHNFGWRALLPVLFTLNYSLYQLFGIHWLPWFLIFTLLHGLNAWMLFRTVRRLVGYTPQSWSAALFAGLLFLLSPYSAEPIVWKACIQYQLSLFLFFNILHLYINDTLQKKNEYLWKIHWLFLTAIYLSEWNIITPAILAFFIVAKYLKENNRPSLMRGCTLVIVPQIALVASWLLVNKYYLGAWVGHDGASTHLRLNPVAMFYTELKYWIKHIAFLRYFEYPVKAKIFAAMESPLVYGPAAAALAAGVLGWVWKRRTMNAFSYWGFFGLFASMIAMIPVSNLFFYFIQWSENDRYGYYMSGFMWMGIVLFASGLPRAWYRLLMISLTAVSAVLLLKMTRLWGEAEKVNASLIHDFRWYDKKEVVVLASPDNLKGVPVMRINHQDAGLPSSLACRSKPYKGKIWEIVQFNMETPQDGIKVETDSTGRHYKMGFMQFGNWWFRNGVGASPYRNGRYSFHVFEWHVEARFFQENPDAVFIYPVGGRWVEY